MSHKSSVPMQWRLFKNKYSLAGSFCNSCSDLRFPAIKLCCNCGKKTEIRYLTGFGVIQSFTTIRTALEGFERDVPYNVVLIKFDEGPVVSGQLVNKTDSSCLGKKVKTVFRKSFTDGKSGINHYGFKFELI